MIPALSFLRAAWRWLRKHALAIVAALGAFVGLLAYLLGRRSTREDTRRAATVGAAEARAEMHDEQAATHTARADAARDEEAALRRLATRAEDEAERKAGEIAVMTPDEKAELGNALIAARRRRREAREP